MQFLTPIWFTALAALIVPVVIHLWNIRPGKTLKVGSISLFEEASPASSRSLQLLDVLLLMLRCLLLALVAALLAAPFWQHRAGNQSKGWVVIPKASFHQTYTHYQKTIDSLIQKGYECRLAPGFEMVNLKEQPIKVSADIKATDTLNYWTLLSKISQKIPVGKPVALFTTNTAGHFSGSKPATALNLHWYTYTPADSVKTWPAKAWFTNTGSIRVVQATSKPSGISYQYSEMKIDGPANPVYETATINGRIQISLKADTSAKALVDTSLTRVAIYAPGNEADANYLRAALEAASKFAQQNIRIIIYHQAEAIPAGSSWLFWLSDKSLSNNILQASHRVVYYVNGKPQIVNTWLSNTPDHSAPQPALFKYISGDNAPDVIWSDGYGQPVLGKKMIGKTTVYPFHSRFSPTWNELVWNEAFPLWMLKLITPETPVNPRFDTRTISAEQLQPVRIEMASGGYHPHPEDTDLSHYLWLAAALVFFAERWLAHKNKIQTNNG